MELLTHIERLNWPTVLSMFAIGWYFSRDIRISLQNLDNDVKRQGARTDKLYEMFCQLQQQMKDEMILMKKEQYEFMRKGEK